MFHFSRRELLSDSMNQRKTKSGLHRIKEGQPKPGWPSFDHNLQRDSVDYDAELPVAPNPKPFLLMTSVMCFFTCPPISEL